MRQWTLAHTSLVDATAAQLERDGYTVLVEGQNRFSLEGASGVTLAGCPDIVAEGEDEIIVIDCKTGKSRLSHEYQVMTYMLCLPHVHGRYKLRSIYGRVQYPDASVHISPDSLDEGFRRYFRELMQSVGGPAPPRKVPSVDDCRFCDIAATYCPERNEFDLSSASPRVDLF